MGVLLHCSRQDAAGGLRHYVKVSPVNYFASPVHKASRYNLFAARRGGCDADILQPPNKHGRLIPKMGDKIIGEFFYALVKYEGGLCAYDKVGRTCSRQGAGAYGRRVNSWSAGGGGRGWIYCAPDKNNAYAKILRIIYNLFRPLGVCGRGEKRETGR